MARRVRPLEGISEPEGLTQSWVAAQSEGSVRRVLWLLCRLCLGGYAWICPSTRQRLKAAGWGKEMERPGKLSVDKKARSAVDCLSASLPWLPGESVKQAR